MKIKIALLIALLLLLCLPALSACGDDNTVKVGEFIYSDGKDGTYTLIGTKYDKKNENKWPDTLEVPAEVDGNVVDGIFGAFHRPCYTKKIILPDTITFINDSFTDCYKLEELDIPDSVTRISGNSFENCPKLIETENGFSYVDNWAVDSNPQAVLATLRPGTIGSIDGVCLLGLMVEGEITLPDDFYYVGQGAFVSRYNSVDRIEKLTVNEIKGSENAFYDSGYRNESTIVVDKIVVKKSLKGSLLSGSKSIGELVIPGESLVSCRAERIIVSSGVISGGVGLGCTSLVIGAGVTSVAANAIKSEVIKKITVEGDTAIAQNAFAKCKGVEEIRGKADLLLGMDIGHLKSLEITGGHVSAALLSGAINLESLTLEAGLTFDENAFAGCTALKNVSAPATMLGVLPTSIKSLTLTGGMVIGEGALAGFTALESITLPASLVSIGADAFLDVTTLKDVYFGGTLAEWASIGFANAAANPLSVAESLYVGGELVTTAEGLSVVSPFAFYGYKKLVSVSFAGITKISEGAFWGCVGLTSLEIPASVSEIGKNAFCGCTALTAVTLTQASNWWRYESETALSGTRLNEYNLTNTESAAQYLSVTYTDYIWKRII